MILAKTKTSLFLWSCVALAVTFVIIAAIHRSLLSQPGYTNRVWGDFEFSMLLALAGCQVVQLFWGIVLLVKQRWRHLLWTALCLVFCLVALVAAMVIDSPTLVYAT